MRVAFAPLLSDVVPVTVSLVAASLMGDAAVRAVSVVGGLALIAMALWSLRGRPEEGPEPSASGDYLRGALTNILNPNAWIFWLGAGAPLLAGVFEDGAWAGVLWVLLFYFGLVGTKVVFAIAVGRAGEMLSERALRRVTAVSVVLMVGVGVWLVAEGLRG